MTDEEIDLKNGETGWQAFQDMLPKAALNKLEMMVKHLGAKETFKICKFGQGDINEESQGLTMLVLKYLEHTYQKNTINN